MLDEKMSLVNIKGGAAVEMFDIALQKIIENIHDINTSTGAREINLKVKLQPLPDNRSIIMYSIACPTKTCGQDPIKGTADLQVEEGKLVAFDNTPKQIGLPMSNVTSMAERGDE